MAPEVFRHELYNNKVDVYGWAMIAYQLAEGLPPFWNMDPIQAARAAALEHKRPHWGPVSRAGELVSRTGSVPAPGEQSAGGALFRVRRAPARTSAPALRGAVASRQLVRCPGASGVDPQLLPRVAAVPPRRSPTRSSGWWSSAGRPTTTRGPSSSTWSSASRPSCAAWRRPSPPAPRRTRTAAAAAACSERVGGACAALLKRERECVSRGARWGERVCGRSGGWDALGLGAAAVVVVHAPPPSL